MHQRFSKYAKLDADPEFEASMSLMHPYPYLLDFLMFSDV